MMAEHEHLTRIVLGWLLASLIIIKIPVYGLDLSSKSSSVTSSRRSVLVGSVITATATAFATPALAEQALIPGGAAPYRPQYDGFWDSAPLARSKLGQSRIQATELRPLQQPLFGEQELYYAPFLFGAWNVTATLKQKIYPYGTDFLPSNSLKEGSPRNRLEQVGNACVYQVHYFSTLANILTNQLTVNLGMGIPETRIIQDRAYNAMSISAAYQQLTPVQEVQWDYRNNPTKVVLDFGAAPVAPDMRPLGPRRAELFINARQTETVDENVFACAEQTRTVVVGAGTAIATDMETITEFIKQTDDYVTASSRIATYLTPNPNSREGVLWQQVGGKAVAFFDYELQMHRIKESFSFTWQDGTVTQQERACVTTPQDVVQCA